MTHDDWDPPTGLEPRGAGRVTSWLVVATLLAQGAVFYSHLETGLYLTVGLSVLVGIAAGLRVDGIASMLAAVRREQEPSMWPTASPLVIAPLATVLVGFVLAIPLAVSDAEDAEIFLLSLGAGLVVVIGSVLGWIATAVVIWPLVHLVRRALRIGGRDPDDDVITLSSLFFLLLVAAATVAVVAVGDAADDIVGTPAGRGLSHLVLTWTLEGQDPQQEALLTVARVLFVLLVICGVAWFRRANRRPDQAHSPP